MLKIIPWIVAVAFIIRGFSGFADTSAAAGPIVVLVMGVLMLPPVFARLPLPKWTLWAVALCGIVAGASFNTPSKQIIPSSAEQAAAAANQPNAARDLVIKKAEWEKGGFGSVGLHSFTVYNRSAKYNYNDVSFAFTYLGESGSPVGATSKVVYKSFPAGKTVKIKELNTGFIDQQAERAIVSVDQ